MKHTPKHPHPAYGTPMGSPTTAQQKAHRLVTDQVVHRNRIGQPPKHTHRRSTP